MFNMLLSLLINTTNAIFIHQIFSFNFPHSLDGIFVVFTKIVCISFEFIKNWFILWSFLINGNKAYKNYIYTCNGINIIFLLFSSVFTKRIYLWKLFYYKSFSCSFIDIYQFFLFLTYLDFKKRKIIDQVHFLKFLMRCQLF